MNTEITKQNDMALLEDYLLNYLTNKKVEKERKQDPYKEFIDAILVEWTANGGTRAEALDAIREIGLFQSWYCKTDFQKVLLIKVMMYMGDDDIFSLKDKSIDNIIQECGYRDSRDLKDHIDKLPKERLKEIVQFLHFAPSPNHFYYFLCEVVKDEIENMDGKSQAE